MRIGRERVRRARAVWPWHPGFAHGSGWQPKRGWPQLADAMGVAQGALHFHEIPWRCSFQATSCHSVLEQLEVCACAAACGNNSRGTCLSVGGCVRHRVCRAGGQRGPCAQGACCGGACRAVRCAAVRLSCGFARLLDHRGCGQALSKLSLGAGHTAWRRVRCEGCEGAGAGAGRWSWMRREQVALRMPSLLLPHLAVVRCGGRLWAAHPREAMAARGVPDYSYGAALHRDPILWSLNSVLEIAEASCRDY